MVNIRPPKSGKWKEHASPAHHRLGWKAAAVALAVAVLSVVGARNVEAAFPGLNGRIVYERNDALWTMDAFGTDQRSLTRRGDGPDYEPSWSASGTKIAFERTVADRPVGYNQEIFTMNADGSGARRLTFNETWDNRPAWSPDGSRIIFMRFTGRADVPEDRHWDIWVMNADGSGQRALTGTTDWDHDPAWSPDGRTIAFSRSGALFLMNPDGTNQRRLSNTGGLGREPDWSPDGTHLVFDKRRDRAGDEIGIINTDGTGERFLTDNTGIHDRSPAFSPNGRSVTFVSCPFEGNWLNTTSCRVRKMTSDGSSQVNLTNPPRDTYHQTPDWQPLPAFRLDSRAITIPFRDIVLISGRFVYGGQPVISGQRLTLWEQPANSFKDFTPVPGAETTTDNDGSFAFEKVQPKANTNYQVRFAGDKEAGLDAAMSQIKPVDVRVLVSLGLSTETLSLGKTLVVSGEVEPAHTGKVILTIKRVGERVARKLVLLDEDSRYSYWYEPQSTGQYSVTASYPADDDHAGGQSPEGGFEVFE